jgi:hypothetical protein
MDADGTPEPEKREPVTESPHGPEPGKASASARPFRVQAKDMGLKPGYNFDKPWDLIEEIEGPDYK